MFFVFYMYTVNIYSRMRKKSYKPILLPSNFKDMEEFIINNKVYMMEQVLGGIDHALSKKIKFIEIFKFANSDFVITLSFDKFKENIDNIYKYYIEKEQYELCGKVKQIEKKLIKELKFNEKEKNTI